MVFRPSDDEEIDFNALPPVPTPTMILDASIRAGAPRLFSGSDESGGEAEVGDPPPSPSPDTRADPDFFPIISPPPGFADSPNPAAEVAISSRSVADESGSEHPPLPDSPQPGVSSLLPFLGPVSPLPGA